MKEKNYGGVAQFFYHCKEQILPVRDILNTNGKGSKTEPHYENLTENWCNQCMNRRIRSINKHRLDYLFLFTRYYKKNHKNNNKYLIVGYLKRASDNRFIELSKTLKSGVNVFDPEYPEQCGFFSGDFNNSIFVNADDGYLINIKHPYYYWFVEKSESIRIIKHLRNCKNILPGLLSLTKKLKRETNKNESCSSSCRN